ncbi:MAG: hypothetical protein WBO08_01860 [Mycobacterium sp.]|nr:hypothetical protein [Mycobacterium sp.]
MVSVQTALPSSISAMSPRYYGTGSGRWWRTGATAARTVYM